MIKKILILIGFLGLFLPAIALAANDVAITQNGKVVTITIPSSPEKPISYDIKIKRNNDYISSKGVTDNKGNIVITDTPDPPGKYTYVVTINGKETTKTVTTTAAGTTTIGNTILPSGEPADRKLSDVETLIANIGNLMLSIAGGVAIIYIIIGAYHYFFAFGSEERATTAKKTITWAIVGLVVIILSKVILTEVWNFIATEPINFLF